MVFWDAVALSGPYATSRKITTSTPHHSIFTVMNTMQSFFLTKCSKIELAYIYRYEINKVTVTNTTLCIGRVTYRWQEHRCKKSFFTFFILVTFLRFLAFFIFQMFICLKKTLAKNNRILYPVIRM